MNVFSLTLYQNVYADGPHSGNDLCHDGYLPAVKSHNVIVFIYYHGLVLEAYRVEHKIHNLQAITGTVHEVLQQLDIVFLCNVIHSAETDQLLGAVL